MSDKRREETTTYGPYCAGCGRPHALHLGDGHDSPICPTLDADDALTALRARVAEAEASSREAFVAGAAWWQFKTTSATMFPSERDEAEAEAERKFPFAPWPHLERIKELTSALADVNRWVALDEAAAALAMAKELLREIACSVWFEGEGGEYVTVQIHRQTWEDVRALAGKGKP